MDLKGIRISPEAGPDGVIKAINNGAEYIILNDQSLLLDKRIAPYLNNKIGEKNGILIYKL